MIVTIAWYFFVGGILSILIIIGRKIPELRAISWETLGTRETFREFVARKIHEIPELPTWFSHKMLSLVEKYLHHAKILSLRLHNVFEGWRTSIRHKKNGSSAVHVISEASEEAEHDAK